MGRAKPKMEFIENDRRRNTTYRTRKSSLLKKTYELATLCDVQACIVIYGPQNKETPQSLPETWPTDSFVVRKILEKYKAKVEVGGKIMNVGLSDFYNDKLKKLQNEIETARKENVEANNNTKGGSLEERVNNLSIDEARELLSKLDKKIDFVDYRIDSMKKEALFISGCGPSSSSSDIMLHPQTHNLNSSIQQHGFMNYSNIEPLPTFMKMPLDSIYTMYDPHQHPTYGLGAVAGPASYSQDLTNNQFAGRSMIPIYHDGDKCSRALYVTPLQQDSNLMYPGQMQGPSMLGNNNIGFGIFQHQPALRYFDQLPFALNQSYNLMNLKKEQEQRSANYFNG